MEIKTKQELINEWREEYGYEEESDEQIWKDVTDLSHLYGDLETDDEWYNILNCMLKDTYGVWFINEKTLKIQVNNAKMNTSCIKDIILLMARTIHKGIKKDIRWLEVIDKTKESFIGQNNY